MSGSTRSTLTRQILSVFSLRAKRRKQGQSVQIEALESRQLLSAASTPKQTVVYKGATYQVATSPAVKAPAASTPKAAVAPIAPLSETFNLSSRPSATKTIYLDFNGHTTSGTGWNAITSGADIVSPAYTLDSDPAFSPQELIEIQLAYQRVVEDFAPFDVNVTTKEPSIADLSKTGGSDTRWGIRVVIGGSSADWYTGGAGGVAFLNSFNNSSDVPCFVFNKSLNDSEKNIAEAISHEVGHTLGLDHDGTASLGYYQGHGSGATSWAPIMGVGYYTNVTQWSKGEYTGANNKEDDLAMITTLNGFGYRNDDYGNSRQTASQLPTKKVGSTRTANVAGVIERNTDEDWFSFVTTGGVVTLNFNGDSLSSNLDISVSLYDATGALLQTVNPGTSLSAALSATLPAGSYVVKVEGVGNGSLATGYSDYGSLGQYYITGSFPDTSSGTATGGTSVISGRVVSDANADGLVNGSDAGIGGVLVFIDLDANGAFNAAVDKSARTDSQGNFKFTGLLGGTYQVYQTVPSGWQQIGLGGQPTFVAANSTTSNVLFRNLRPPVLSSMSSAVSYKAGSAAILLAPSASVTDSDTTTFTGARLNVSLTQNGDPTDILSIRNQGNGAGQVGYFGGVVRYSGVVIGSVSGGISGSDLVISFNSSANLTSIRAVLRNLTFVSTSPSTSKAIRTISYSLFDGTGGLSSPVSNQVKVT